MTSKEALNDIKQWVEIIDDNILEVYNETTKESIEDYNIPTCVSHRFDDLNIKKIYSGIDGSIYIIVSKPDLIEAE